MYRSATLWCTTRLLLALRFSFCRLRALCARVTGRPWGQWDGEAWCKIGARLFGSRTVLAVDTEGHRVRVRPAQWVDLTSLVGRPEEKAVERIVRTLPVGGTFVDAGAHIGRYSLMAADAVGPSGRVFSVEPSPDNLRLLCENAALNGMSWITPVQAGLGKEDGTAELISGSDQAVSSFYGDWLDHLEGSKSARGRSRQTVAVRSLPRLLADLGAGRVDLLKMDIEGAELDVLKGALPSLRSGQVRQIVCEVHDPTVRQADLEACLRDCGFRVKDLGHWELHAVWEFPRIVPAFRLAIIGCGAITEYAHIPAAGRLSGVRLVGLVDTDLNRAQALASRHAVPLAGATLDDVIGKVDGVILATPPHVRSEMAQYALGHGLHVLCEKPMANSADQCRQMMEKAQVGRCILAVAHTYRFFPNRACAHALYQTGRLGSLILANINQGDPYGWPSRTAYTLRREWVPGGVLFNEGVHILDMLLWWFGAPQGLRYEDDSLGGLESNVRLTLNYAADAAVHFRLSRTCSLANRIEMEFEKASLSFPVYNMSDLEMTVDGGRSTRLTLCEEPWDFVEAATIQLRDFVLAATQGCPSNIPAEAGLAVIELIESCYRYRTQRSPSRQTPLPGITW